MTEVVRHVFRTGRRTVIRIPSRHDPFAVLARVMELEPPTPVSAEEQARRDAAWVEIEARVRRHDRERREDMEHALTSERKPRGRAGT